MLRKALPWLLLALFILAVLARLLPGPRTIDDAYITFRYARNLLGGAGFSYNPGVPVLGTTTPLFTFLLAGLALPFGGAEADFPHLALAVSALADGLTVVLLFAIGQRLGYATAGFSVGLVWAVAPLSVTFAIGGLETSIYVLLLVGLMWAYLAGRIRLTAGLAAAAILTRPDAVLLVAPLLAHYFVSARPHALQRGFWRANWKAILVFLLPLLVWALFAWLYFGSPFTQSVAAKSNAYRIPPYTMLAFLVDHYATPFTESQAFSPKGLELGLSLYLSLSLLGSAAAWKKTNTTLPFALFPWLHFFAFAIANPPFFRWYLTPPLPFYCLLIAIGVQKLAMDLKQRLAIRDSTPIRAAATALILLPALLSLRSWTLQPDPPSQRPAPEIAWMQLETAYMNAADFLRPRLAANPGAVLAATDVGVLGYSLDVHILDLVGLNSKETLPYYPLNAARYGDLLYAVSPDLVMDQRPEYVVIFEIYGRYGLLQDPRFLTAYELVHIDPTDFFGPGGLLIYELTQ